MRSQSRGREARPELNTSLPHDVRMTTETQIYFLGLYWVYVYIRQCMKIESDIINYPLFPLTPCTIWRYHSDIFCSTPYHICECRILKYSPLINLIHILAKIVVTFKTFRLVRKMDKRSESVNQNSWVWSENVDIRLIWIHYYDQMLPRICNNTSTWHQE